MPPHAPTPVYLIAQFHVPDVDRYRREYGREVLAQVTAAGPTFFPATGERHVRPQD